MKSNAPDCARCEELLLDFAYGELAPADRLAIERHLATCEHCRAAAQSMERTRRAMSALAPEAEPSTGVESLLAYAAQSVQQRKAPARARWRWLIGALPVGGLLAVLVLVVARGRDAGERIAPPHALAPQPGAVAAASALTEKEAAEPAASAADRAPAPSPSGAAAVAGKFAQSSPSRKLKRIEARGEGGGGREELAANGLQAAKDDGFAAVAADRAYDKMAAAAAEVIAQPVAAPAAPAAGAAVQAEKKVAAPSTPSLAPGAGGGLGALDRPAEAGTAPGRAARERAPASMLAKVPAAGAPMERDAARNANAAAPNVDTAAALLARARARAAAGARGEALVALEELLERFPSDRAAPAAALERVRILRELGRAGDAARAADELRRRYPDSKEALAVPASLERSGADRSATQQPAATAPR